MAYMLNTALCISKYTVPGKQYAHSCKTYYIAKKLQTLRQECARADNPIYRHLGVHLRLYFDILQTNEHCHTVDTLLLLLLRKMPLMLRKARFASWVKVG